MSEQGNSSEKKISTRSQRKSNEIEWPGLPLPMTNREPDDDQERRIVPLASAIIANAKAQGDWPDYLDDVSYSRAVMAWARAEAITQMYWDQIVDVQNFKDLSVEKTIMSEKTEPGFVQGQSSRRSVTKRYGDMFEQWRRWETLAMQHRSRLGLDPLSRSRLQRDVASTKLDLASLWAKETSEIMVEVEKELNAEGLKLPEEEAEVVEEAEIVEEKPKPAPRKRKTPQERMVEGVDYWVVTREKPTSESSKESD